jgi:hypothetical protein
MSSCPDVLVENSRIEGELFVSHCTMP